MTKYLALTAIERGIIGVCFYKSSENFFELSITHLYQIKSKIAHYQPNYLVYASSGELRKDWIINQVKPNFPLLNVFRVENISKLGKKIVNGETFIPGLERKAEGFFYPEYYFAGKKINKAVKKALFVLFLHKPWQEVGEVKFGDYTSHHDIPISLWKSSGDLSNELTTKKNNEVDLEDAEKIYNYYLLKNINMSELNLQVQELTEKLSQMSKLSYLGNLKSTEILFLVQKSRNFASILDKFYTLKKNEEETEQKKETKINNNGESNENTN